MLQIQYLSEKNNLRIWEPYNSGQLGVRVRMSGGLGIPTIARTSMVNIWMRAGSPCDRSSQKIGAAGRRGGGFRPSQNRDPGARLDGMGSRGSLSDPRRGVQPRLLKKLGDWIWTDWAPPPQRGQDRDATRREATGGGARNTWEADRKEAPAGPEAGAAAEGRGDGVGPLGGLELPHLARGRAVGGGWGGVNGNSRGSSPCT